jgi:uncharacterized cupin superfamily protein
MVEHPRRARVVRIALPSRDATRTRLIWHLPAWCGEYRAKLPEEDSMERPILNLADVELQQSFGHGDKYGARIAPIGPRVGAQRLGYNLTVVPPGKRAFPFHCHRVNEEMFFVLEGEGEVRIGGARHPIRRGDVIACPPGGPESAHQIVNTSSSELRYLAVSTKMSPEVAEYPDSGKFGVLAEYPSPDGGKPTQFRFVGRAGNAVDYWDGE